MAFKNKSPVELLQLLNAGASLTFDASGLRPLDVSSFVLAAKKGGGILTLTNISTWSQLDLVSFVTAGGKHLVLAD